MSTLLTYAPALAHTKAHHPENHTRMLALLPALEKSGSLSKLIFLDPEPATIAQLRMVHTPELIEFARQISSRGGGLLDHGDTYATAESFELARTAAGACCAAVDAIMTGQADNGFALVRPPGHHAETDRVSGFCLFNNVAAAARQAQVIHGVNRVAIIDFDVHHGNGTQDIFFEDDSVLFISLHLFTPFFYPGTGAMHEVGVREAYGYTVNIPFPPYVGDIGYGRAFDEIVRPKVAGFEPDLILVSAGFDAHWQDPLAMSGLSLTGYAHLVRALLSLADDLCQGRIIFILEGGYQLEVLCQGVLNTCYALLGEDKIGDPFGLMPRAEEDIAGIIERLKRLHLPY
jgi:acetoin utilization deacetylase AcuC-like enzyme